MFGDFRMDAVSRRRRFKQAMTRCPRSCCGICRSTVRTLLDRMPRFAWAPVLAVLISAASANAQTLRGHTFLLRDSATVAGVLVQLTDSAGRVVAQTLSDQRGRFALVVQASGQVRLRGLRIGFRPSLGNTFTLPGEAGGDHALGLSEQTVVLDAFVVSASQRCPRTGREATIAFNAWDEARKALTSSLLTRGSEGYAFDIVLRELQKRPDGDSILSLSERDEWTNMLHPFRAVTSAQLDATGFVFSDSTWRIYAAPDENILLSEAFGASHCLRAIERRTDDDSLVLAFSPSAEITNPDIEGTVVLSRKSLELQQIAFRYVNVSSAERDANAGGTVDFHRLPTGGWIINRWQLRIPVFEKREVTEPTSSSSLMDARPRTTSRRALVAIQETGGEVVRALYEGREIWRGPSGAIVGILRDSAGRPITDATVTYAAFGIAARPDSAGHFRLSGVRLGTVELRIAIPFLDSLELKPHRVVVQVRAAPSPPTIFRLPSRASSLAAVCPLAGNETGSAAAGFLRGTVRDRFNGRAGPHDITIAWTERLGLVFQSRIVRTRSDVAGDYRFCGAPRGTTLTVTVLSEYKPLGSATVTIPRDGVLHADVVIAK